MKALNFLFVVTFFFLETTISPVSAEFNSAYVCSFCAIVLGLVEQAALQIQLETYLKSKCDDSKPCLKSVERFIESVVSKLPPDEICKNLQLCPDQCTLYTQWPITPPPEPEEWPTQRRKLLLNNKENNFQDVHDILLQIAGKVEPNNLPVMAHAAAAVGSVRRQLHALKEEVPLPLPLSSSDNPCARNLTCKIEALVDHKPLQDHDGDYFATEQAKTLRGSDWRGTDCDDKQNDVYPGRKVNSADDDSVDHDCNGIVGGNSSGSYEGMFCKGYPGRGLIMLGDSATAHFHIPPQWVTARGWNLDGLLQVAENEIDSPMCSWGTGHVEPELCPYQQEVPGVTGVTSLYLKMLQRNRCSANDFQNIGVNGARMTSSQQLVDAMARDAQYDKPALVWLSLIGNDVCNGHPGFDHMTPPDTFYENAVKTLRQLDERLAPGSHVVALALFDGELLYDTMHALQHPVGTTYHDLYDFMNCLEENPCWGWLNSNSTDRKLTTQWSNDLNNVYRNISETLSFQNFDFIFYSPLWTSLFADYQKTGLPLSNLIEPVDGFHPSQAGNAMFAEAFWKYLEENHPDAIGPENPHNEEIDKVFGDISILRNKKMRNLK